MTYTAMTQRALRLCYQAHHGQLDKSGMPYVFHPFHLAEQMSNETEVTVALLHDVVEDTSVTFEQLEKDDYPPEVLEALRLLTHDPAIPYMDYVAGVKQNPIARRVKLADLRHNSDVTRMPHMDDWAMARQQKYLQAIAFLDAE